MRSLRTPLLLGVALLGAALLAGAASARSHTAPKPAWSQARLTGTWYHVIKQSDYDALGIGDQSFPTGRYKMVVDSLGFFNTYSRTAPKKVDFIARMLAKPHHVLWLTPPPVCGPDIGHYHGRIVGNRLTITNDDEDKDCYARRAIFVGVWTKGR